MQEAFGHCEALVRAADKDRFLATLFAPVPLRGALYALYAFNIEVARVREVAREPMPGEIRLQWWREVLHGERSGEARANPVAAALKATIEHHRLPLARLAELIDARSFDLYDEPMATLADLETYALKTSASVIALAAQVLGGGEDVSDLEKHAGIAYAYAGLLQAFPLHAARRQLYVPIELLARHNATAADVFAGKSTAPLRAALAELRGHARAHLAASGKLVSAAPLSVLPALLPATGASLQLDRMDGSDPFAPPEVPQWRRQWRMWRAARDPSRIAAQFISR